MASIEVLDLEVLKEMGIVSGNQPDSPALGVVAIFLREERPRLAQLPRLLEEKKGADLALAAHSMAGSCAILGARQAQAIAVRLEHAAREAAWTEAAAELSSLRDAWLRLEAALAEFQRSGHP